MPAPKTTASRKAGRRDKLARWIITLGGIAVIASVIAILAMIVGVTLPLFRGAQARQVAACRLPATLQANEILALGVDLQIGAEDATITAWSRDGSVALLDARQGQVRWQAKIAPPATGTAAKSPPKDKDQQLRQVESLGGGKYWLVWPDGAASLVDVAGSAPAGSRGAVRTLAIVPPPKATEAASGTAHGSPTDEALSPGRVLARRSDAGAVTRVALLPKGRLAIYRESVTENLGEEERTTHATVLQEDAANITAMAMDREGSTLYTGTADGRLLRWKLDDKGEVAERDVVRAFSDKRAVTALALMLGEVSLAVGDARGGVSTWFPVRADGARKLRLIHRLDPHSSPVREILPSPRNKTLVSLDEDGGLHVDYMTSERHLLSLTHAESGAIRLAALGARGDALAGLDDSGRLTVWRLSGGHPEVSLRTLFGKVFYESYDAPTYAWQTTGGEDFEPKFSLVPLVFGTLKGTFYAMLFATPLALAAAAYVSYFATPALRGLIKPVVEIMATVPSVVIGFLIALWLAPILERWVSAFFLSIATIPAVLIGFLVLWQLVRRRHWAKRLEKGYEFLVTLPVLLAGVAVAVYLSGPLENGVFGGNFARWLGKGPLQMPYDPSNSIIIAFGLGFTVVPLIFSMAEDSLSNVPYSMTAASMAVGASRWQTFWHVILPSASPGIFAATMIGFGRAVGETMIVLMATGNTPILDWSPLNGMRTLSANIAVEMPEAPVGGTLYRVLFLCAVLLFVLTFTVNTAAEVVRQHLRKRYGKF